MGKYDSIIESMSDDEIHIMEILGKLCISPNKNININTLKKRLHKKYTYSDNFEKIITNLKNKGLIGVYRQRNINASIDGMIIAKILYKRKLNFFYPDMSTSLLF